MRENGRVIRGEVMIEVRKFSSECAVWMDLLIYGRAGQLFFYVIGHWEHRWYGPFSTWSDLEMCLSVYED